jgi:RHS repeat-associated protein
MTGRLHKKLDAPDRQHTTMMANLDSTYGYHGGSGLASISYPSTMSFITPTAGPSYNYSYNSMEQLSGMTSGSTTLVSNVTYNAANQLLTMNYGVSESRGYNSLNQLTTLNNGTENLTYTYPTGTNNGKISSMYNAVSGETVTYTYDSLNRIATASGSIQQVVQWDQSYVFDPFGNLLQKNIAGGSSGQPSTQVTVNNQNQITSVYGLTYDANGNAGGGYDAENRLVGGPGMYYGYDAQNKRIWSWTGAVDTYGNTTNYTVNIYSPSGQKLGAYVIAPWFVDNSQTMWVTVPSMQVTLSAGDSYFGARRLAAMDQLGSVGNYFPWGEDKGGTSPQDTWNYATYWRDSVSGLDYANNRYYSNAYGRFMTDDPSANNWDPANPQSWNTYAYANGDPVNGNDPDGLDCSSTGFYFNGVYQGTIGDLIGAQSSISILATAMYTESGHGKGVDVSDEEYSIGAVIMNRWEFVNKNWYLSSSAGGPSLNVSGWGTPGDSITSIVENPSQFAIYVNNASGGISLSASAQKNLNSALSSSADSSGCGDLAFALTLANGMWDERNDGNPLYLYNNLILTGFNSFNPPHSSAPYEQKAGSFGDANTFYGVPESYVSETPIRVRPRRPAPPRRPHDIQGQQ